MNTMDDQILEQSQPTTRKNRKTQSLSSEEKKAKLNEYRRTRTQRGRQLIEQQRKDRMEAVQKLAEDPDSKWNQLEFEEKEYLLQRAVYKRPKWESAMLAFNSRSVSSATDRATKLERRPEIQLAIKEVYEAAGVTAEKLAETVAGALGATKTYVDKDSGLIESDAPDHATRLAAAKMGHEMRDEGSSAKRTENVTIKVDARGNEELEDAVAEALLKKHKKKRKQVEVIDVDPID